MTPPKAAKKAPTKKAAKKGAPGKSKAPAKASEKAGAAVKSDRARRDTAQVIDNTGPVPIGANGLPMVQIQASASELIPTGEYANVVVGPVTVVKWIEDPGDDLADEVNDLCETIEADVISVQRTLVLESLQDEVGD